MVPRSLVSQSGSDCLVRGNSVRGIADRPHSSVGNSLAVGFGSPGLSEMPCRTSKP